jgi:DNA-binding NarL/FixJ family response regulator
MQSPFLLSERPVMQPTRILLVDDHPAMLKQLASMFPEEFHVVAALGDGRRVAEAILEHRPDVIVLDITLPGLSGIQVASHLRRIGIAPKIIFLTVHNDPDYARAAFDAGGLAYVVKMRLASDLMPALRAVSAGQRYISPSPELKEVKAA